ncbi:hypothetical protein F4801DRAFT_189283 [Xylaria longipes]|nr:hypothetical protein F4801DRAFT_189283 [Xylaria longipes]
MSYARYSTTDRWRWVDGCVHEHVCTSTYKLPGRIMLIFCLVGPGRNYSNRQVLQTEYDDNNILGSLAGRFVQLLVGKLWIYVLVPVWTPLRHISKQEWSLTLSMGL